MRHELPFQRGRMLLDEVLQSLAFRSCTNLFPRYRPCTLEAGRDLIELLPECSLYLLRVAFTTGYSAYVRSVYAKFPSDSPVYAPIEHLRQSGFRFPPCDNIVTVHDGFPSTWHELCQRCGAPACRPACFVTFRIIRIVS